MAITLQTTLYVVYSKPIKRGVDVPALGVVKAQRAEIVVVRVWPFNNVTFFVNPVS